MLRLWLSMRALHDQASLCIKYAHKGYVHVHFSRQMQELARKEVAKREEQALKIMLHAQRCR